LSSKNGARLDRLYNRLGKQFPAIAGLLRWAQRPSSRLLRVPLGILLVLGGVFSFLPILGVWMLPLGLMLLAVDFPPLQGPVVWMLLKGERWLRLRGRRKRQKAAAKAKARRDRAQDTALP
jgi:hypothetical protein